MLVVFSLISVVDKKTSGISRGSVLEPMIFVIYINNLSNVVDTKIFRPITRREDALQLQLDKNSLESWSKKWFLTFHPE